MNTRSFKTAILVLLIIGVIAQTGRLWFEESSGHNFFSSMQNRRARVSEERYKIAPGKIMVNFGNSSFAKLEINASSEIRDISESHISQLIKNGKVTETLPLSWLSLLEQKSVIYMYPLVISPEAFARSYSETAGQDFRRIAGFDTVAIKPARSSSESMSIYVADSVSGVMHRFETLKGVSEPLSKEIDILRQANQSNPDGAISYISSAQNSLDFFEGNVFLPEWQPGGYAYPKAYVTNPFDDSGDLEKNVQFFFDNPAGLLSTQDPAGVPFVSDKDTVVKYYAEQEVLEYTNYGVKKTPPVEFDTAYGAARNFLARDSTLNNDVYMTGASLEDGEWKIYFDYEWGGLRVFCSQDSHAIEITVTGGNVSKYRRTVKRLEHSELYDQFSESFISALDRSLAEDGGLIDNIELGYDLSGNGFREIMWFVESYGKWEKR